MIKALNANKQGSKEGQMLPSQMPTVGITLFKDTTTPAQDLKKPFTAKSRRRPGSDDVGRGKDMRHLRESMRNMSMSPSRSLKSGSEPKHSPPSSPGVSPVRAQLAAAQSISSLRTKMINNSPRNIAGLVFGGNNTTANATSALAPSQNAGLISLQPQQIFPLSNLDQNLDQDLEQMDVDKKSSKASLDPNGFLKLFEPPPRTSLLQMSQQRSHSPPGQGISSTTINQQGFNNLAGAAGTSGTAAASVLPQVQVQPVPLGSISLEAMRGGLTNMVPQQQQSGQSQPPQTSYTIPVPQFLTPVNLANLQPMVGLQQLPNTTTVAPPEQQMEQPVATSKPSSNRSAGSSAHSGTTGQQFVKAKPPVSPGEEPIGTRGSPEQQVGTGAAATGAAATASQGPLPPAATSTEQKRTNVLKLKPENVIPVDPTLWLSSNTLAARPPVDSNQFPIRGRELVRPLGLRQGNALSSDQLKQNIDEKLDRIYRSRSPELQNLRSSLKNLRGVVDFREGGNTKLVNLSPRPQGTDHAVSLPKRLLPTSPKVALVASPRACAAVLGPAAAALGYQYGGGVAPQPPNSSLPTPNVDPRNNQSQPSPAQQQQQQTQEPVPVLHQPIALEPVELRISKSDSKASSVSSPFLEAPPLLQSSLTVKTVMPARKTKKVEGELASPKEQDVAPPKKPNHERLSHIVAVSEHIEQIEVLYRHASEAMLEGQPTNRVSQKHAEVVDSLVSSLEPALDKAEAELQQLRAEQQNQKKAEDRAAMVSEDDDDSHSKGHQSQSSKELPQDVAPAAVPLPGAEVDQATSNNPSPTSPHSNNPAIPRKRRARGTAHAVSKEHLALAKAMAGDLEKIHFQSEALQHAITHGELQDIHDAAEQNGVVAAAAAAAAQNNNAATSKTSVATPTLYYEDHVVDGATGSLLLDQEISRIEEMEQDNISRSKHGKPLAAASYNSGTTPPGMIDRQPTPTSTTGGPQPDANAINSLTRSAAHQHPDFFQNYAVEFLQSEQKIEHFGNYCFQLLYLVAKAKFGNNDYETQQEYHQQSNSSSSSSTFSSAKKFPRILAEKATGLVLERYYSNDGWTSSNSKNKTHPYLGAAAPKRTKPTSSSKMLNHRIESLPELEFFTRKCFRQLRYDTSPEEEFQTYEMTHLRSPLSTLEDHDDANNASSDDPTARKNNRNIHDFFEKFELIARDELSVDFKCYEKGYVSNTNRFLRMKRRCKRINKNLKTAEKPWDQVRAEMSIVANFVKHPNLVQVLDFFEDYQYFYLVYENYGNGNYGSSSSSTMKTTSHPSQNQQSSSASISEPLLENLAKVFQSGGTIKEESVYRIIDKILKTLDYVRNDSFNLPHGKITVDNVFVRNGKQILLVNYGLEYLMGLTPSEDALYSSKPATCESFSPASRATSVDFDDVASLMSLLLTGEEVSSEQSDHHPDGGQGTTSTWAWSMYSPHAFDFYALLAFGSPSWEEIRSHPWLSSATNAEKGTTVPRDVITKLVKSHKQKSSYQNCLFELFLHASNPKIGPQLLQADSFFKQHDEENKGRVSVDVIGYVLSNLLHFDSVLALKAERVCLEYYGGRANGDLVAYTPFLTELLRIGVENALQELWKIFQHYTRQANQDYTSTNEIPIAFATEYLLKAVQMNQVAVSGVMTSSSTSSPAGTSSTNSGACSWFGSLDFLVNEVGIVRQGIENQQRLVSGDADVDSVVIGSEVTTIEDLFDQIFNARFRQA
ncbi:unnamed protein product [Amoebophrya sp. A120]|nr:unnamed protein product [Amoebophrya sp. A120]|eukprot:GSA120T00021969001.1